MPARVPREHGKEADLRSPGPPGDIDTRSDVWVDRPGTYNTQDHYISGGC